MEKMTIWDGSIQSLDELPKLGDRIYVAVGPGVWAKSHDAWKATKQVMVGMGAIQLGTAVHLSIRDEAQVLHVRIFNCPISVEFKDHEMKWYERDDAPFVVGQYSFAP